MMLWISSITLSNCSSLVKFELSISIAPSAFTRGESWRVESIKSRSCTFFKTASKATISPLATNSSKRRLARVSALAEHLEGTYMLLDEASVTGTANIVMASVLAKGKTTIYNAACEPYLQQLCRMLNSMGAKISGIASNLLTIEGVESLHGCTHRVLPDMIEVGSFIGMAAMTGSELTIKNVSHENLGIIPESFRRLGIRVEQRGDDLFHLQYALAWG